MPRTACCLGWPKRSSSSPSQAITGPSTPTRNTKASPTFRSPDRHRSPPPTWAVNVLFSLQDLCTLSRKNLDSLEIPCPAPGDPSRPRRPARRPIARELPGYPRAAISNQVRFALANLSLILKTPTSGGSRMLATLVIFLREGVEASMIVAILLAYLNRIGRREHFRDVFIGVGAALLLATGGGIAAYETIRSYDGSRVQTIFETVTYLVAATVLTYMTFWMRSHARSLSKELRARADAALDGRARWGLGLLAFQAVGREGLETVVFTLAIIFSTSTAGALAGAAIGLAGALGIAFVIYRLGHRLNLARFFTVIGILLMVFAAGLLADSVENLQQLGWLPVLDAPMWHSARLLSENSAFGDVLHSFFGYSDAPTPLQLLIYVAYLGIAAAAYLGIRARPKRPADQPHPAARRPAVASGHQSPGSGAPSAREPLP